MDDKDFEKIYRECNPIMSFGEIYYECNVKPLVEQVLREANEQNYVYRKPDGTPDENYPYIGLFPPQILNGIVCRSVIEPQLWATAVYKVYKVYQNYKDYIFLPCNQMHKIATDNLEERKKLHNAIKAAMINAQEHKKGFAKDMPSEEEYIRQRNNFEDSTTDISNEKPSKS
jgi:hypothetical protein